MTPRELADRQLAPYRVHGVEASPMYCPFCGGGQHRDKYTFSMNLDTGAFKCMRGSCGAAGGFRALLEHFGEERDAKRTQRKTAYKLPSGDTRPITATGLSYLQRRGLTKETAQAYRVGEDGKGNLVFPFFDADMQNVFAKYRPAHDVKPGERKAWRDKDTKPILYGMHLCDPVEPLCIFEGELDAMSGYQAGIPNCVSVPSGAQDLTWIDTCWQFLERFDRVYLFGDNDEPGRKMQQDVIDKLAGWKLYTVPHACKDANELLTAQGPQALRAAYDRAVEVPVYGLLDLGEVEAFDPDGVRRVLSGIPVLDRALGGFQRGDVTVWTGRRGEGKSTMLTQIALEAMAQGECVCLYSGELSASRVQYWMDLQAAGPENIRKRTDTRTGRTVTYVPDPQRGYIHAWYKGRAFVYDNTVAGAGEEKAILQAFNAAVSRKGCGVFIVDNLMTARLPQGRDGFFQAQSAFVGKLVEFAAARDVIVHLVAHPRKGSGELTGDDIAGTGDIANRAANVITLERLDPVEQDAQGYDVLLRVIKNRWEGVTCKVGLAYDADSHRMYVPSQGNTRQYDWGPTQIDLCTETPFE